MHKIYIQISEVLALKLVNVLSIRKKKPTGWGTFLFEVYVTAYDDK